MNLLIRQSKMKSKQKRIEILEFLLKMIFLVLLSKINMIRVVYLIKLTEINSRLLTRILLR